MSDAREQAPPPHATPAHEARESGPRAERKQGASDHRITLPQGIALYVGAVLGTGVIALPSLAVEVAGPASLVAWAALVFASVPLAAVFAALAARYPGSGGVATYVRQAFGHRAAAVTGWWFYAGTLIGIPALGLFGGAYVATVTGGGTGTVLLTCAALLVITAGANMVGLRLSGRLQLVLSSALAALLVLTIVVSLPQAEPANLTPFAPHGWLAVGSASMLLVWAFAGWEAVPSLAGDFVNPKRDLPRATAAAVVIVGVLYLGIAIVTVLALGPAAASTNAPLAVLLSRGIGTSAKLAAATVAVIITLGTMNAYLASTAKLGAALGQQGALPGWFARGAETGEVPRRSLGVIVVGNAVTLVVVAVTGMGTEPIVVVTSAFMVAVYAIGSAAGLWLLPRRSRGWWAASGALAVSVAMLALSGVALAWPAVCTVAALVYVRYRHPAGTVSDAEEDAGEKESVHSL